MTSNIFPTIDAPFTTIVNRAQVTDFSKDLKVRMGVDRFMTQRLVALPDEQGPNGENVFGVVGDKDNAIRFVGDWGHSSDALGNSIISGFNDTDYVEIVISGTGLNGILHADGPNIGAVVSVDGGAESSNLLGIFSSVLASRNYSSNMVISFLKNLSENIYTIKIRSSNALDQLRIYGFETINESYQLIISEGETSIKNLVLKNPNKILQDYNAGFESGVLGVNGGRVAVYLKPDGTIGKSLTPVGNPLYLTSSDHSNEEVVKKINFREFGANRGDDFSTLSNSNSSRAFTLLDGATSLVGLNVRASVSVDHGIRINSGQYIVFSFVGTGLDATIQYDGNGLKDYFDFTVDGVSVGSDSDPAHSNIRNYSICSGLEMGSHIVKVACNISGQLAGNIGNFIIYQPKTPSIPTNCKLIGTYNLLADFVANTISGLLNLSIGILRKDTSREAVYIGTWTASAIDTNFIGGIQFFTETVSTVEYTFFGTGIDVRFDNDSLDCRFSINDNFDLSGFTTSFYQAGTATFTDTTGVVSGDTGGGSHDSGLIISNLPLGLHTIKAENTSGASFRVNAFDIITPIHSYKSQLGIPYIGSQGISDEREYLDDDKYISKTYIARGKSVTPTTTVNTSSNPVQIPEMVLFVNSIGEWFDLTLVGSFHNGTAGAFVIVGINVNGIRDKEGEVLSHSTGGGHDHVMTSKISIYLKHGFHKIEGVWHVSSGTGRAEATRRKLIATTRNGEP